MRTIIAQLAGAGTLGLLVISGICSQAQLPPAAQAAIQKGQIAAQQQDYVLAANYFQDARKAAPNEAGIYGDLGLAESKVPGRELRAMAWFGAYLAAVPNAPNAEAVKNEITALQVKNEIEVRRLLQVFQGVVDQVANGQANPLDAQRKRVQDAAPLYALSGDMPRARELVATLDPRFVDYAELEIAGVLAQAGDIAGAQEAYALVRDPQIKNSALASIAGGQIVTGDFSGAQQTVELLPAEFNDFSNAWGCVNTASTRLKLEFRIAQAQSEAGDLAGAARTIDILTDVDTKAGAQMDLALAQAKVGDKDKSRSATQAAIALFPMVKDRNCRQGFDHDLETIVELQIKGGDIAGAQATAESIADPSSKSVAEDDIAEAQVEAGDLAAAERSASLITIANPFKSHAQNAIFFGYLEAKDIAGAEIAAGELPAGWVKDYEKSKVAGLRAEAGDIASAKQDAEEMTDHTYKDVTWWIIADAQAKHADVAEAKSTLEQITDPATKCSAQLRVAEDQVNAGDIAGGKLTISEARQTIGQIVKAADKEPKMAGIAHVLAEAGDMAGAQQTEKQIVDPIQRVAALISIAEAQSKAGDRAGAGATLLDARSAAGSNPTEYVRFWLVQALAQTGDIEGATQILRLIPDDFPLHAAAVIDIAEAQLKAGDRAAGEASLNIVLDSLDASFQGDLRAERKSSDYLALVKLRAQYELANPPLAGRIAKTTLSKPVAKWIDTIDHLNTPIFLDASAYLKTLAANSNQGAADPGVAEFTFRARLVDYLSEQFKINRMLKEQDAER